MRNLVNFDPTTQKPENFISMGFFLFNAYKVWTKKNTEELSFMNLQFQKWDEKLSELSL